MNQLPSSYKERMKELLNDEYADYEESFSQPHYTGLRVNTLKISPEEFLKISPFELKPIPWTTNGFYYNSKEQPAKHPYYYAGLYYIQEPSAMTPAQLLPVTPGDKVLDLCAAPGGKSTELAAKLQGEGVLVSNDISNSRAKALLKNIEVFGVKNAVVTTEAPNKLSQYFEGYFDKILVDAPCSGEGMFRKDPSIIKSWEKYGVGHYNGLQLSIVPEAIKMLKPGGMMLYSTCTFSPEENEGTIQFILDHYPNMKVVAIENLYEGFAPGHPEWIENGSEDLTKCVRLWPHKIKGEGHFIALLQKKEEPCTKREKLQYKSPKLSDECTQFLKQMKDESIKNNLELREERLYSHPDHMVSLKGIRILRNGMLLGEMKKNRFEPSQALANALKAKEFDHTISFAADDPRVIRYLKGETIDVDGEHKKGYQLILVDGFPIGWGKLSGNTLKNKYLPGWRML